MNQPPYIVTPSHITIHFPEDEQSITIYSSDDRYEPVVDCVVKEDWEQAKQLIHTKANTVKAMVDSISDTRVDIIDGLVYLDDVHVDNSICVRMIEMASRGFNVEPMKRFLVNMMENPSYRAVQELYEFLEATQLPITDDGHFIAYKMINSNWTDCHTGKMDNSIGAKPSMPRNHVNDDRHQTCSNGLHFCGRGYLSGPISGGRTVVVKVNPRDVVSIPSDYNNAKGRACTYEIMQEIDTNVSRLEELVVVLPSDSTNGMLKSEEIEHLPNLVVCQVDPINDVIINRFPNTEAAEIHTGIRAAYIDRVLSGDRATTGGYAWRMEAKPAYELDPRLYMDVASLRGNKDEGPTTGSTGMLWD